MPRLLRPHIPLHVRCAVALRQLGEMWPEQCIDLAKEARSLKYLLNGSLRRLAELMGTPQEQLQLDHDPALENREKVFNRAGVHVEYVPAANDPEYLIYREKHAHHIKTNVRGDGAQYPDRVLAKRERKRAKKQKRIKPKWPKRKLRSANRWPKRKTPQRAVWRG